MECRKIYMDQVWKEVWYVSEERLLDRNEV